MTRALPPLRSVTTGLYLITAVCGLVDAVCFLALGGVFAEMMTGNLLLLALSLGTGGTLGDSARYVPAILAFVAGALLGGRLLRGPQKMQERRIGFAVEWLILLGATAVAWLSQPDDRTPRACSSSPCSRSPWGCRTPWSACTACPTSPPT
ncbi:MAG: DUF1275 family protein [Reyranella sp.]|nr:DUF1275 family protein [Reyranella sp.]